MKTRNCFVPHLAKNFTDWSFIKKERKKEVQTAKRHLQLFTKWSWILHRPGKVKCQNSIWWTKLTLEKTEKANQPCIFQGTFSVSKNDLQSQTHSNNDTKATSPKGYNIRNYPNHTDKMISKGTSIQLCTPITSIKDNKKIYFSESNINIILKYVQVLKLTELFPQNKSYRWFWEANQGI